MNLTGPFAGPPERDAVDAIRLLLMAAGGVAAAFQVVGFFRSQPGQLTRRARSLLAALLCLNVATAWSLYNRLGLPAQPGRLVIIFVGYLLAVIGSWGFVRSAPVEPILDDSRTNELLKRLEGITCGLTAVPEAPDLEELVDQVADLARRIEENAR